MLACLACNGLTRNREQLANSYSELLDQFASKELKTVGNYSLGKLIGKGSFGKVYLAKHNLTNGSKVVLKASKKDDPNLAREIHHHRQFIHPHIARLYEVIITESLVWLVLEYCPGDELYNYLCKNGPLPVETVQKIFTQLVGAVSYIHSKSCVHRDLKLENVLLDKNDNVKLCDFGFTREYEGKANYLQTFCGTVCYSAPEMLKGEKYAGEKVDVWSLGIILYALLKGELPFDEDDDAATKAKILKDDPVYPDTFPEAAKTLVSKLLSKRPLHRPTLSDILADPFLSDHAPHQQAILKLSQPAAFTTQLEKETLERMKSAGVDIDKVIENVLSQRCDALAGWWALLIEKETRKQARRERKRKEREAELKILRRLSGASSRLERIAPTLVEVDEEHSPGETEGRRSSSRGRTQRRSTPQILVGDLPQLPEGDVIKSPEAETPPPPPIDKDSVRSRSGSRPPIPPKERKRRSSTLQLVTTNPELLGPMNGVNKRRSGRFRNRQFLSQLTALKQWIVDSTKRARSPVNTRVVDKILNGHSSNDSKATLSKDSNQMNKSTRNVAGTANPNRSSNGSALTPVTSNFKPLPSVANPAPRIDTARARPHRNSLSPSPVTPRSSYRRSSTGLRSRKSTSSSVSSIRSMPRHNASHSKASSQSSNSLDTIHSPTSRTVSLNGRSPHPSIKVLPVTPTANAFPSNIRLVRTSRGSDAGLQPRPLSGIGNDILNHPPATPQGHGFGSNVMFARRKKSPFKGPMLNSAFFSASTLPAAFGSPAVVGAGRNREGSEGKLNLGLKDFMSGGGRRGSSSKRKNQIIEEEEEDEHAVIGEEEEEDVEEVDAFQAVHLNKGERLDSITIWSDAVPEGAAADDDGDDYRRKEGVGIYS
ncbi:CAMK/CAMKL/MARK protein kinase [Cladophialophora psammophila CBS 110553]|uniref:CAMK/CAMKL/MARK protein kinase n=1 Tax=Cladophialophora psammophila CBS 110553 TaxID=1182543 RepID=W9X6Q8_9EURO|nr:CAMK/CAMKL/MARK protein kinase [Cladophialophora psammophila CBS 110553]EXJ75873.1 CAMK/CAMKL/MARK protein kinase [Cladophialophora psammophila CBS 110553]